MRERLAALRQVQRTLKLFERQCGKFAELAKLVQLCQQFGKHFANNYLLDFDERPWMNRWSLRSASVPPRVNSSTFPTKSGLPISRERRRMKLVCQHRIPRPTGKSARLCRGTDVQATPSATGETLMQIPSFTMSTLLRRKIVFFSIFDHRVHF